MRNRKRFAIFFVKYPCSLEIFGQDAINRRKAPGTENWKLFSSKFWINPCSLQGKGQGMLQFFALCPQNFPCSYLTQMQSKQTSPWRVIPLSSGGICQTPVTRVKAYNAIRVYIGSMLTVKHWRSPLRQARRFKWWKCGPKMLPLKT